MKEITIDRQTEGIKLIRFLGKLFPAASSSFLYKMLRKKNITLNDKKCIGSETLKEEDIIKIYFSDETYSKFAVSTETGSEPYHKEEDTGPAGSPEMSDYDIYKNIIFEDEDIILVNKPAGILSQKASAQDNSMVDIITRYLTETKAYAPSPGNVFRPAVTNRLDRNTSGIVAAGKSVKGLKYLSEGFKNRRFEKFYMCPVDGIIDRDTLYNGLWSKDSHGNKVRIKDVGASDRGGRTFPREYFKPGNIPVQTAAAPLKDNGRATLLKVELLTGKSHQIRAQLATAGHPLIGDHKYGVRSVNDHYKRKYGLEYQLLHAFSLKLPEYGIFYAEIPGQMEKVLIKEGLWLPGIQEVFGDRHLKI